MKIYNKLVRDKIPEIMVNNNETPITRILDEAEYKKHLDMKLEEETKEYLESGEAEELADILEVVFAEYGFGTAINFKYSIKEFFELSMMAEKIFDYGQDE